MKTRGGTVIKPGAAVKKGKVTRISKRLKVRKDIEVKERLAERMKLLSKRFEIVETPREKKTKELVQVVEPEHEEEEEEEEEENVILPEKIISVKEFDILRKRAIRILDKDQGLRSLMKTSLPNIENIKGHEGNGWRTAEEENLVDAGDMSQILASEGWKVICFTELDCSSLMNDDTNATSSSFPLSHVWISPSGKWIGRWSDVVDERKKLVEADVKIGQVLAIKENDNVVLGKEFIEGARLRFIRDGVWIGREPWPKALSQDQIASISKLTMTFFEQVLHTVAIRGLEDKLDIGFSSFRERGKGRFDLNPPALLDSEYSMLRDLDAPSWMPLVKAMLSSEDGTVSSEVRLIHMGVFMSLPDSDTQVYHTDGVHLSEVCHLPPHAVNVFIPLIPLTDRNSGPTEFSLGSHIFGNDAWDKAKLEIPAVSEGTPIIFDYRVGHRGLSNRLSIPRPVLYFTYSNKPGFKDQTNFSKKRYVPLPELLELPSRKSSSRS